MTLPLTYSDIVCYADLDGTGAETTSDLQNLKQDLFHVLWQVKGSNPDDLERGVDIVGLLSGTVVDFQNAVTTIDTEFEKDTRVDSSSTTLTQQSDGSWLISTVVVVDGAVVGLAWSYGPEGLSVV